MSNEDLDDPGEVSEAPRDQGEQQQPYQIEEEYDELDFWKGDAKFVVVEDGDETWSDLPSEEKILASTASFTCPVYFG